MNIQTGVPCKWTNDSQRFLLEHFDMICGCPSHIYYSALPLSPSSSWVTKCYSVEFTQAVKVVKGPEGGWGTCSRTVSLDDQPNSLSCWNNFVAVGSGSGKVIILDATTGSQTAVLSGHRGLVMSVAFSSDGTLLVSGSHDKTVKLWDVQTGGVIKTFVHPKEVLSVSVSVDCSIVASGTVGGAVHLLDIQKGESKCIIKQRGHVEHVIFSSTNPQHIISISGCKVQQWNIDGHEIGPTYEGSCISFSSDHTHFALCCEDMVTVQSSDSGAVVAGFHADDDTEHCCFSPDNKLIAAVAGSVVYVWDIISSEPHLLETFEGHTDYIVSLAFLSPSTLISSSWDGSVKFWQIEILPTAPVMADPKSTSSTSSPIRSVSLQVKDGIAFSSDLSGVVKTWDILTGLCKRSFQTPAQQYIYSDAHLIKDSLVFIWNNEDGIHFWDSNEDKLEKQVLGITECGGLRISEDGSQVFCLTTKAIKVWSIWTWECVGSVEHGEQYPYLDSLHTDHSKIWVRSQVSLKGWDFGVLGSPPVLLVKRPPLDLVGVHPWKDNMLTKIRERETGKEVFQLSGRYAKPTMIQWNGQYLVAGYQSGDVFILDIHHLNAE